MRHRYSSNLAFNDILFNILLLFVFLFVVAVLFMNPPTKKADIPTKAEFIVIMEWDNDSVDDIDLWLQYNATQPVGYRHRESSSMHLERDDLGHATDTVVINGASTIVPINREVITVRGLVPGDYFVGIHGYNVSSVNNVRVTVVDVNPYKEIYVKDVVVDSKGQKINLPAFTVNEDGEVKDVFEHFRNLGPISAAKAAAMYGDK